MRGFKTVPPPQKFMDLSEIHINYGIMGVVAYGCKMTDGAPEGGYVVAVQEGKSAKDIKEYLRQFKKRFPEKAPACYMRVPIFAQDRAMAYVYDLGDGDGEKKALPKLEAKKPTESERLVSMIPDDIMAKMISTAFKRDE